MRARIVGFAILYPLRFRIGSTAPSRIGLMNLFECQDVASGPVSASPSPMTQATMTPGLAGAMPLGTADRQAVGVREAVAEFAAFVNRAWRFRRHMTADVARK